MAAIDLYANYLHNPIRQDIPALIRALIESKDISKEMFDVYKITSTHYRNGISLKSNGSTYRNELSRDYPFGPHFLTLRHSVESFLAYPDNPVNHVVPIAIFYPYPISDSNIEYQIDDNCIRFENRKNCVKELIEVIEQNLTHESNVIRTYPRVWNWIINQAELMDYFSSLKNVNFANTDSDAFLPHSRFRLHDIIINDQMVNWKSGVNFYTCKYGNRHEIKNLYFCDGKKYYNLLNLFDKKGTEIDDITMLSDEMCSCGKHIIKKFYPHFNFLPTRDDGSIFYDLNLADALNGKYISIQFLKNKSILEIHYTGQFHQKDKDIIKDAYNGEVKIIANSAFRIGAEKYNSFWTKKGNSLTYFKT